MEQFSNIFVSTNNGDDVLVYVRDYLLSPSEVEQWARKAVGDNFNEAYEIREDEIQYYYVSNRIWVVTKTKAERIRAYIYQ